MEDITGRIDDIRKIRSARRVIYDLRTATNNIDSNIGDDFQLDSAQIIGDGTSIDLKIITLDKSNDEVRIQATDLQEL